MAVAGMFTVVCHYPDVYSTFTTNSEITLLDNNNRIDIFECSTIGNSMTMKIGIFDSGYTHAEYDKSNFKLNVALISKEMYNLLTNIYIEDLAELNSVGDDDSQLNAYMVLCNGWCIRMNKLLSLINAGEYTITSKDFALVYSENRSDVTFSENGYSNIFELTFDITDKLPKKELMPFVFITASDSVVRDERVDNINDEVLVSNNLTMSSMLGFDDKFTNFLFAINDDVKTLSSTMALFDSHMFDEIPYDEYKDKEAFITLTGFDNNVYTKNIIDLTNLYSSEYSETNFGDMFKKYFNNYITKYGSKDDELEDRIAELEECCKEAKKAIAKLQAVTYTITTSATNGTITESKSGIEPGESYKVSFSASDGYEMDAVYIDGVIYSTSSISSYTFTNISKDHIILVIYKDSSATGSGGLGTGRIVINFDKILRKNTTNGKQPSVFRIYDNSTSKLLLDKSITKYYPGDKTYYKNKCFNWYSSQKYTDSDHIISKNYKFDYSYDLSNSDDDYFVVELWCCTGASWIEYNSQGLGYNHYDGKLIFTDNNAYCVQNAAYGAGQGGFLSISPSPQSVVKDYHYYCNLGFTLITFKIYKNTGHQIVMSSLT